LSNFRTDEYGGSFENRIRLTLEVLEAVQSGRKFAFIGSNFSFRLGRWLEFEESIQLSKILKEKGVDLIDVSSGGAVSHQQIPLGPNYQVAFAESIKTKQESQREL
jgi:2,4-dienoyl-CoA reductase-like NADH-dependent reductase (Old Yellow Enzyme family)